MSLSGADDGSISGHDRLGSFEHGYVEGRREKRNRIAKRTTELLESYDAKTPADLALIALAASHLDDALSARSRLSRARSTNAAMRLLRDLRRKTEPLDIDEILGRDEVANGE